MAEEFDLAKFLPGISFLNNIEVSPSLDSTHCSGGEGRGTKYLSKPSSWVYKLSIYILYKQDF